MLMSTGRTCVSLGLPEPLDVIENEDVHMLCEDEMQLLYQQVATLNPEQLQIFNRVMNSVNMPEESNCFFIDGPGGSGKTYLLNIISKVLRAHEHVVQPFATTGIASLLMEGGRTAHSGYKLPIPCNESSTSTMQLQSVEAAIMRSSTLHIIDEIPMLLNELLRCIDKLLRDIKRSTSPFGNTIMVGSGDFRQTCPVVPRGSRARIVLSSIKASPLWPRFQQFSLATNMRAQADPEFAAWQLQIGCGKTADQLPTGQVKIPTDMIVPDIVTAIYGSDINLLTTEQLAERVILASTNKSVLEINNHIIDQLHGEARTYLSADSVIAGENDFERYSTEFLNQQTPSGMPPHELTLKVGTIVILLRNINLAEGMCNGTRIRIRGMYDHFLSAEVLTGSGKGNIVFITRIDLTPSDTLLPFHLRRRQFPILPAFAMTINKSQGQTFEYVGVFLDKPVFTHGQLYTAISRCRRRAHLKFCIVDTEQQGLFENGCYYTPNIVFRELLNSLSIL